ncbi:thiolase family protein [Nocardia sp. NPDC050799]|uniref:thiolase family protein n=1 Tax=Nocardia sp. NPDC050799 TaxID=3154842 RepID=UPI0033D442D1
MRDVYVGGTGVTKFGLQLDRNLKDLAADATTQALRDAGCEVSDIQSVYFGNCLLGMVTGLEANRGAITMMPMGFGRIPFQDIENACATGANAMHIGWLAVASGLYDTVLVVGAEKLNLTDRKKTFAAYDSGFDPEEPAFEQGEGAGVNRTSSADRQATLAKGVMEKFGVDETHFGRLAAVSHYNGSLNPKAHRTAGLDYDAIMSDRVVVPPLTRAMLCPISDGAAAVVLTSRRPDEKDRRIRLTGSRMASRMSFDDLDGPAAAYTVAQLAYEAAGISPEEIGVAAIHDASVSYEITSIGYTGLCPPGEERAWIEKGEFGITGRMPINTAGGQIARGHPVGATGVAQIAELADQLRGRAGAMQVDNPRVALAHIAGGVIRFETAAAGAHILVKD